MRTQLSYKSNDGVIIEYQIITAGALKEKADSKYVSFFLKDVWNHISATDNIPDILYITKIFTPYPKRNKGYGSNAIQDLIETHSGKLTVLMAGALECEYAQEPSKKQYAVLFAKLEKFYLKNNFININEWIGQYENHVCYAYNNEAYQTSLAHYIQEVSA